METDIGSFMTDEHKQAFRELKAIKATYKPKILEIFRHILPSEGKERAFAKAECACGATFVALLKNIKNGNTTSCGCRRKVVLSKLFRKHGETSTRKWSKEILAYYGARKRCQYKGDRFYKNYGGRGIQFKFESYEQFLKVIGRAPSNKHSLERIDVNGHYEPGNVKWATMAEQANNTRLTVRIELDGKVKSLSEWCDIYKIKKHTFFNRRRLGWKTEEIFKGRSHDIRV